jgi:hypothetical protein
MIKKRRRYRKSKIIVCVEIINARITYLKQPTIGYSPYFHVINKEVVVGIMNNRL